MSPLEQAKEWLDAEQPSKEEIQQSVDNLCHQVAHPPVGCTAEQFQAAIGYLMQAIGKDLSDVVLPQAPTKAELDLGPLGGLSCEEPAVLSLEEKRQRFDQLKIDVQAPPF